MSGILKNSKTGKEPSITAMYHDETRNILLTGNKEGSVVCWSTKNLGNEPIAADGLIALFRFEISTAPSSVSKEQSVTSTGSATSVSVPDLIAKQVQSLCFRPLRINGKYVCVRVSSLAHHSFVSSSFYSLSYPYCYSFSPSHLLSLSFSLFVSLSFLLSLPFVSYFCPFLPSRQLPSSLLFFLNFLFPSFIFLLLSHSLIHSFYSSFYFHFHSEIWISQYNLLLALSLSLLLLLPPLLLFIIVFIVINILLSNIPQPFFSFSH